MNSKIFISYLNTLKREYGRFILFYDGTPWHTSGDVEKFMMKNRKTIMPERFPRFNRAIKLCEDEEVLSNYLRRNKFNLDIVNY